VGGGEDSSKERNRNNLTKRQAFQSGLFQQRRNRRDECW